MAERIKFFGLSDNNLFYDERKKRFAFLEDAPAYVEKAYKNAHFKEVPTPLPPYPSPNIVKT